MIDDHDEPEPETPAGPWILQLARSLADHPQIPMRYATALRGAKTLEDLADLGVELAPWDLMPDDPNQLTPLSSATIAVAILADSQIVADEARQRLLRNWKAVDLDEPIAISDGVDQLRDRVTTLTLALERARDPDAVHVVTIADLRGRLFAAREAVEWLRATCRDMAGGYERAVAGRGQAQRESSGLRADLATAIDVIRAVVKGGSRRWQARRDGAHVLLLRLQGYDEFTGMSEFRPLSMANALRKLAADNVGLVRDGLDRMAAIAARAASGDTADGPAAGEDRT